MPRRKTEQEKNKERNKNTCDNESDWIAVILCHVVT